MARELRKRKKVNYKEPSTRTPGPIDVSLFTVIHSHFGVGVGFGVGLGLVLSVAVVTSCHVIVELWLTCLRFYYLSLVTGM